MLRCLVVSTQLAWAICACLHNRDGLDALNHQPASFLTTQALIDFMNAEVSAGFSARPDPSTWQQRFDNALTMGKAEGCDAKVWFCCINRGLGAAMMPASYNLMTAIYAGVGFVWKQPEVWPSLLKEHLAWQIPTSDCPTEELFFSEGGTGGVGMWFNHLRDVDSNYTRDLKRFVFQKIWVLTPAMQSKVAAVVASLDGNFNSGGYFGIHVRRGDKLREAPYVPTSKYVEIIKSASAMYPHVTTVYVASDDPGVRAEVQAALGSAMVVAQAPETARTDPSSQSYTDQDLLDCTVRDIEILRGAKVFVGTATSSMSKMIYFARSENDDFPDVSLEGEWLTA